MHNRINLLQPYPFQKLADLFAGVSTPDELAPIRLSIGEPKHAAPRFVLDALTDNLQGVSSYPVTKGSDALRETIASWLQQRYQLSIQSMTPESHILPVNGTREGLFSFAQCIIDNSKDALVCMPNPFYQIYEGAAILAGADTCFINSIAENNFLPDLDGIPESAWKRCQLFYACSPDNPTGAIYTEDLWKKLLDYADRYDFIIAADECYSEIYNDEDLPPTGLLETCFKLGRESFSRCVVFHSLSKRSNLPGLRSGFVAGDKDILEKYLLYRTYHGCAMPPHTQAASAVAWGDEAHVAQNRQLYREKFAEVTPIINACMDVTMPQAGFYLWPEVPGGDDEAFAQSLYRKQHVTVLPGSYLSRDTAQGNPGKGHVRMALVADADECIEAAKRIADHCKSFTE